MKKADKIAPVHPGEILLQEVLEPANLSQNQLASMLGVPANRINAIVRGQRSISADTAIRLGYCLNTNPEFWMALQTEYDLQDAQDNLHGKLDKEVSVLRRSEAA